MSLTESLLQELEMEAATTRRVLERVPDEKLAWRPAEKSRTLGQLVMHIATNPGAVAGLAKMNPAQLPAFDGEERSAFNTAEVLAALDASVGEAKVILSELGDAGLMETWRLTAGGREIMALPRIAFLRSIMFNHWYHHRGQLSVYLRELQVRLPSIYGPTADENPFAPA